MFAPKLFADIADPNVISAILSQLQKKGIVIQHFSRCLRVAPTATKFREKELGTGWVEIAASREVRRLCAIICCYRWLSCLLLTFCQK